MIRDLILNFCLITIFMFFSVAFIYKIKPVIRNSWSYKWKIGLFQGVAGVILMCAGIHIEESLIIDFRAFPILVASYLGGPLSAFVSAIIIILTRLFFAFSAKVMIKAAITLLMICITSIVAKRYVTKYWAFWLVAVSSASIILFLYLLSMQFSLTYQIIPYIITFQIGGVFVAFVMYYLINSQLLKQKFDVLQMDLLEILQSQAGLTYKVVKENGKDVYDFAGGDLSRELGIPAENLVGRSVEHIRRMYTPTLHKLLDTEMEKAWQGQPVSFEANIANHTVIISLKPIYEENEVQAIIGSVTKITERKRSEEKLAESEELYRSIVEGSYNLIFRLQIDGKITSVNQRVREICQMEDRQILGMRLDEVFPSGEHIHAFAYYFDQAVQMGTAQHFECSLHVKVQKIDFNVILSPFYMNHSIIGITCTMHDVTDIKKRKEADEANQAKSEFLARMSHEIRTPLSGVIGLSELLQRTEMSPVQQDYLHKILYSSHTLMGIINDVLDFSKIESGKIELDQEEFNVCEMMQGLSDMLSALIGQKQLKFIIDTSPDIPETLIGDSLRIEQIMINLINNAIKFTEQGYIFVKVEPVRHEDELIYVEFSVEDTGIGLTKEQICKLFKPFTQLGYSRMHKHGGTGLGLSICKHFVDLMSGTMDVESQPGKGSKFSFILPFTIGSRNSAEPIANGLILPRKRVLVVENNPLVRQSLCTMLETMNLEVNACADYKTCDIGQAPYDVILSDLGAEEYIDFHGWVAFQNRVSSSGGKHVMMATPIICDRVQQEWPDHAQPDAILLMPVCRGGLYQTLKKLLRSEMNSDSAPVKQLPPPITVKGNRVLLAEDNEINQLVVTEYLTMHGYSVTIANNGLEVLEELQAQQWDIVLMDIHMPEMDGIEATRLIRADRRYDKLPIIALTAGVVKEDYEMYEQIGMNDVLTKPLEIEKLLEAIHKHVTHQVSLKHSGYSQIEGIDIEAIRIRVGGKENIVWHMLSKFQREYSLFIEQLRAALAQNDRVQAQYLLHTLKGVAANISASELFNATAALEKSIVQGEDDETAANQLERELQTVLASLQSISDEWRGSDS
ncbi:response regulator [Paenibacillus aestuarii]|uniref:histidine kinase n=1 Tax=Paenibacillus aestuarii TaxID=516965 RepID=A0ABW0K6U4_9BACL|nr:response regulator [Paenibacillus aestuarii]